MKRCSVCQYENDLDISHCALCGHSFDRVGLEIIPEEASIQLSPEEEEIIAMNHFVGEKADYYNRKWEISDRKGGASFNLGAAFFAFMWLGYRKLYKPIFILALAFLIIDIILFLVKYEYPISYGMSSFDRTISTSSFLLFAFFSNSFYKLHVKKQIQKINHGIKSQAQRVKAYREKGGTSWLGVLYSFLIMTFIYWLPTLFIPIHINEIELVQSVEIKYALDNQSHTITIRELLDNTFSYGIWDYQDKSVSRDYILFTGNYEYGGQVRPVTVLFYVGADHDIARINQITDNGEVLDISDERDALNYILNLMIHSQDI